MVPSSYLIKTPNVKAKVENEINSYIVRYGIFALPQLLLAYCSMTSV